MTTSPRSCARSAIAWTGGRSRRSRQPVEARPERGRHRGRHKRRHRQREREAEAATAADAPVEAVRAERCSASRAHELIVVPCCRMPNPAAGRLQPPRPRNCRAPEPAPASRAAEVAAAEGAGGGTGCDRSRDRNDAAEEPAFIEVWRPAGRSERRPHRPRRPRRPQQAAQAAAPRRGGEVAAAAPAADGCGAGRGWRAAEQSRTAMAARG